MFMKAQKITHSIPAWILGERKVHPKFGGGIVAGIPQVKNRLLAIKKNFPNDLSSGHVFLEIGVNGKYAGLNKPGIINCDTLFIGIERGFFPKWSAMTAPAFALDGAELGSILNEDAAVRERARWAHLAAIKWSRKLKKDDLGEGISIWWPAFDGELNRGPLSELNRQKAREMLIDWWVETMKIALNDPEITEGLRDNEPLMWFEYKPSVPAVLDFFPTMQSAIWFCIRVNEMVGRRVFVINLEFAHALIGGETVKGAVEKQIKADLFYRFFHANSAELAIVEWNSAGKEILAGTPGDDKDWAIGEGGEERWNDQEKAIGLMLATGQDIIIEHDIDPSGENPIECYARSRANAEKMIANIRARK
jgi:hypothetical protein